MSRMGVILVYREGKLHWEDGCEHRTVSTVSISYLVAFVIIYSSKFLIKPRSRHGGVGDDGTWDCCCWYLSSTHWSLHINSWQEAPSSCGFHLWIWKPQSERRTFLVRQKKSASSQWDSWPSALKWKATGSDAKKNIWCSSRRRPGSKSCLP